MRTCLLRKAFDLLRNSPSTVSIYADECELLAFGASLTSASLSKKPMFWNTDSHVPFDFAQGPRNDIGFLVISAAACR